MTNEWVAPDYDDTSETLLSVETEQYRNPPGPESDDFSSLAMQAAVVRDGCVDLWWVHRTNTEGVWDGNYGDDVVISNLDMFIDALVSLREKARSHFGNDWPYR